MFEVRSSGYTFQHETLEDARNRAIEESSLCSDEFRIFETNLPGANRGTWLEDWERGLRMTYRLPGFVNARSVNRSLCNYSKTVYGIDVDGDKHRIYKYKGIPRRNNEVDPVRQFAKGRLLSTGKWIDVVTVEVE